MSAELTIDRHQPLTRDQLDTLISIGEMLQGRLSEEELNEWFFMPNDALDGMAPVKAVEAGETEAVRREAGVLAENSTEKSPPRTGEETEEARLRQ